ncbi:hypothetical protein PP175_03965 [Aneurinibacillus sp. Ricciae_BoGa-3]|uniref:Eco57I restriction-modification methylase domain-containing protein n=1 Tax=Aneurinibacillus sp. Ricciae_BoGa-3 TaxID=3022697 RepID=UPI0023404F42|nr:type IIL restriction-modification enzyme MmeI [Aneurinibacillus sp. Ricciae_BoGa-3]WCK55152.1 hypothetical protein PP175_03965 [Aneurinibacillus sp. Ricciae_BoGa-3]
MQDIELIADAMMGEALRFGDNSRYLNGALDTLSSEAWELIKGNIIIRENLKKRTLDSLLQASKNNKLLRKPFHWPLEFPEVFTTDGGGFDAIVGNPPFMGGRRMRGSLGDGYVKWLSTSWPHASLNADLVSFFYLRATALLKVSGEFGLLATKTIGEGDTARTGLSYIVVNDKIRIRHAWSSFTWPGKASVTAALVVGHKGDWKGLKVLDGNIVKSISPALDDQEGWGEAKSLSANKDKSYQGSVLRGKGFILSNDEVNYYLKIRSENKEVIFPFLSGEDINSHPKQKASRWTINFKDLDLEECNKKWPELLERLRKLVKPERDKGRNEEDRKNWWQHWRKRDKLYNQIKEKDQVFAISRVTKYVMITSVNTNQVFSDAVVVLDLPSWASFSALQCSFHELWVRRESSSMKRDIRYTPSDSFDTFPFLHLIYESLESIGKKYHKLRQQIMLSRNEGLTQTYNRFHNPGEQSDDIKKLRKLHVDLDKAVAKAYGWEDLKLNHNFYETKYGIRYTISEDTANKVIQLLLKLNHELCKEESKFASKIKTKSKKRKPLPNSKKGEIQLNLFE